MPKRPDRDEASEPPTAKRRAENSEWASKRFPELAKTMPALKKITYKQCKEIAEAHDQYVKDANPATADIRQHFEALQAWMAFCKPFEEIGFTANDFRRISEILKETHYAAEPAQKRYFQCIIIPKSLRF